MHSNISYMLDYLAYLVVLHFLPKSLMVYLVIIRWIVYLAVVGQPGLVDNAERSLADELSVCVRQRYGPGIDNLR